MATEKHPVTLSTPSSYTLDDAVAYLLGLLDRGFVKSEIKVTLSGIAPEDLNKVSNLPCSLNEHLIELINSAKLEDDSDEVARIDHLLMAADIYMQFLTDEIAKGQGSSVRLDPIATQESGVPHFTLKSIRDWYQSNKEELNKELGLAAEIETEGAQSIGGKAESEIIARNRTITLGLLLKLFIEQENCGAIYKDGDQPNFSTFGDKLEGLIKHLNGGKMAGQSKETIRRALSAAYKELPRTKAS